MKTSPRPRRKPSWISTLPLPLSLLAVVATSLGSAGPTLGQASPPAAGGVSSEGRFQELESRVAAIEESLTLVLAQLDRLVAARATASAEDAGVARAVHQLAGNADAVRAELSRLEASSSGAAQPADPSSQPPAAEPPPPDAPPLDTTRQVPYGGYMEMHVNHDEFEPSVLDFHRFVILFGHEFTDRIRFVGELEVEHAFIEGGEASGELEVEQAYLDFLLDPTLSARAGMMLTPIGLVNERHEPASFHGVERPFVDTFIIPSTWFANGGGIVGQFGSGLSLKAFAMSTLNGAEFNAEEGFREGRQKGFLDDASNLALAARVEYAGVPRLGLGASYWTGNTGFELDLGARASFYELDATYSVGRLDLRGQLVLTELEDSAELNRAIERRTGINPNNAEEMLGYYLEGAFHLFPASFRTDLAAFYRYELYDTQRKMAPGFLPINRFRRNAHTIGLTYFPHPDITIKADYNFLDNESDFVEAGDKWNLGLGWWF